MAWNLPAIIHKTSRRRTDKFYMQIFGPALAGLQSAGAQIERSARTLGKSGMPGEDAGDQADLSAEVVAIIGARHAAEIDLKVAQAADETERALLTLVAGRLD